MQGFDEDFGAVPVPEQLQVTALSQNEVLLSWDDPAFAEFGYEVERATSDLEFAPLVSLPPDSTIHLDDELDPSTAYYYRVRPITVFGDAAWTESLHAETHGEGLELWSVANGGLDPFADSLGDGTANLFSYYSGTDPNEYMSAPFSLSLDPLDPSLGLVEFFKAPGRNDVLAFLDSLNVDGEWEVAWAIDPSEEGGLIELNVNLSEGEDGRASLMRLRLESFDALE